MNPRKPPTSFLWRTCLLAVVALPGAAALYAWLRGYEGVTAHLAEAYGYDPAKLRTLLTPARFAGVRAVLTGAAGVGAGLAYRAWHHGRRVAGALRRLGQHGRRRAGDLRTYWRGIPRAEKAAVAALWLFLWAMQAYVAFRLPFHVDERFTYLYFVQPGWLASLAYYPGPNNHILFTLLCNVTALFLDDPFRIMKATAVVAGAVLPPVFWLTVRRHFGAAPAWLATAAGMASDKVFYYATQGRGYGLLALWVTLAAYAAVQIGRGGADGRRWHWALGGACVLGFYTVPVFLYPFAGLALYLGVALARRRAYGQLRRLLVTGAGVGAATALLYLPVLLVNGPGALTGNAWVARLPGPQFRGAFAGHLQGVAAGLWYGDGPLLAWLTAGVLALALGTGLARGAPAAVRHRAWLLVGQAGVVVLLPALQGVLPPGRAFGYLAVFAFPVAAWGLAGAVAWLPLPRWGRGVVVLAAGTLLCAATAVRFVRTAHDPAFGLYDSLDAVAALLYRRGAESVFTRNYEYNLCIRFAFRTRGEAVRVDTDVPAAGVRYGYVVVPHGEAFPAGLPRSAYRLLYEDPQAVVWELAETGDGRKGDRDERKPQERKPETGGGIGFEKDRV